MRNDDEIVSETVRAIDRAARTYHLASALQTL